MSVSQTLTSSNESDDDFHPNPLVPQFIVDRGFRLLEPIGSGRFAKVFRAEWTAKPGVVIACKRIEIESVDEEWREKCLKQELLILKKLTHPHVVKVYELIKTRRLVFIFMELAQNGTISDQMVKVHKPLKESRAKLWFRQLVGALHYMHSKGIAHRDLKLDNFLLNSDWDAMVSDFGFATLATDKNREKLLKSTQCGTFAYMAPEVHLVKDNSQYNAFAADLYSMGVCLYEMLNYEKPFDEKLGEKVIALKVNKKYRLHRKVEHMLSKSVKDLIDKLLEPNPELRIKAEQTVKHPALHCVPDNSDN